MPRSSRSSHGGAHGNLMHAAMSHYHQQISAHVEATVNDLHQRWSPVKATLHQSINRLTQQMAAAEKAGATVDTAWLSQSARLAELKSAVMGDVSKFATGARQIVGEGQTTAATLGSTAAQEALAATVPPGIAYTFGVTPTDVLAQQAGALQPGTPLSNLFTQMGADAGERAQQALFTSVAIGEGAAAAAQRLVWATDMSVQRAELIARTELMRSWRGAQLANYRANADVVRAWQWSCEQSPRSCGACIAMDGSIHTLDEQLDGHVSCRCSALPITLPWSDILSDAGIATADMPASLLAADARGGVLGGRETGAQWFERQAPGIQNAILGPAKAEAYRRGDLSLAQLVGVTPNPLWGPSIQERSLKALGLDAQKYLAMARGNGTAALATRAELADATVVRAEELSAEARAAYHAAADAWYASIEQAIAQAGGTAEQRAAYTAASDAWHARIEQSIAAGNADAASLRTSAESWYADIERLIADTGDSAEAQAARQAAADEWYARIQQSITGGEMPELPMMEELGGAAETTSDVTLNNALELTPYSGPSDTYLRQVAENLAPRIEQYAALHPEMSVDEYKAAVAARLQQLVNGDVTSSVRVPEDVLSKILDDGRLKSSHEAGKISIDAEKYNAARVRFEEQAFGYTDAAAIEERPISGYLTDAGTDNTFAMSYGDARLILSDDARRRATLTFGDSLDYGEGHPVIVPRPVDDVSWDVYHYPASDDPLRDWGADNLDAYQEGLRAADPLNWQRISDYSHAGGQFSDSYLELQIHGGVRVDDIQQIIFTGHEPPSTALTQRLDAAGITWRHDASHNPWLRAEIDDTGPASPFEE